ncbi:MAG: hypothetical protein VB956_07010, partial [Moraxella sp.]
FHFGLGLCGMLAGVLWLKSAWSGSRMRLVLVCVLMTASLQALTWGLSRQVDRIRSNAVQQGSINLHASRNFYGLLKVTEWPVYFDGGGDTTLTISRDLLHGRISHGSQYVDPELADRPVSYFGPLSGIGLALTHAADSLWLIKRY